MIRVIFRQIIHRMRRNAWLLLELALVFGVVWYMVDYFFVWGYNLHLPSYSDRSHIWQVELDQLPPTHPEYQPGESDSLALETHFARVMDRLQDFPGVEAVAVSFSGGLIGSGSYTGITLPYPSDTTRDYYAQSIFVDPRYDYFRVYRLSAEEGRRPVSLHDYDWADPRTLVICSLAARQLFGSEKEAVGKEITSLHGSKGPKTYVIGGVIDPTKRFAYLRPRPVAVQARRADHTNIARAEISLRSASDRSDAVFLREVNEKLAPQLRIGNFYLRSVCSLGEISDRTSHFFGYTNAYYVRAGLLLFFLVNITLCVIGSFWYRVRMRRAEIGLHMAMGATRRSVRRMFILEGLCLLTLAMIPAVFVESQVVYAGLLDTLGWLTTDPEKYLPDYTGLRFLLTNVLTWLFLAAVVTGAIWLPAQRAAKLAPADALHEE